VIRGLQFLILTLLLFAAQAAYADQALVLITSADSPLQSVSSIDLRKLYLGFIVNTETGHQIRPVTNDSDSRAKEVFLQSVVGMSARSYDRRLLTLTLRTGRHRPEVFRETAALLDRIADDAYSIAFVWNEDVAGREDIRILRVLWQP
jgi:hypothetical protein